MEGGQCGVGGDGGEERGHAGSRFVVYSHEAAAEHRGRQREGVEKGRGEKKQKEEEKAVNSYLPALEEVESRTDVGNPVDPL